MLKKMMVVAGAAMALLAMSAPMASATIYDKGVPLVAGQNPTASATGPVSFHGGAGGVACATGKTKLLLTGGTTAGHVEEFTVEAPTDCEVSGGLVFLTGGTTTLKSVELTTTPSVTVVGDNLTITNVILHNTFHNGFKLTLDTTATHHVVATPNNAKAINTFTLGGTLLNTQTGGTVNVTGDLTVLGTDNGTYGTTK